MTKTIPLTTRRSSTLTIPCDSGKYGGGRFSALLVHRTLADAQKFDFGEPFYIL
jgi:hypothetical protein